MFQPFVKMHGAGNDFVVIDNRNGGMPALDWKKLADRQFGIGCDQVVLLDASNKADVQMRIINADGSEVGSCGNASRCAAWLLYTEREDTSNNEVTIETLDGIITAHVENENRITVDMGAPNLEWESIPLAKKMDTLHLDLTQGELRDGVAVSMGNPHAVFFVKEPYQINLGVLGPSLEKNALFPKRANISVARIESSSHITLRVWERGAGLTLACGTAACATLVAAHRRGLTGRNALVDLPGGTLLIEWRESDNHVWMTGPVATSFVGTFESGTFCL